jgi:hypothetical protein
MTFRNVISLILSSRATLPHLCFVSVLFSKFVRNIQTTWQLYKWQLFTRQQFGTTAPIVPFCSSALLYLSHFLFPSQILRHVLMKDGLTLILLTWRIW